MVSPVQSQLTQAELAPVTLGTQISAAIAAKSLNAARQQGAAVIQLLDDASGQSSGAPQGSTGSTLDVMA